MRSLHPLFFLPLVSLSLGSLLGCGRSGNVAVPPKPVRVIVVGESAPDTFSLSGTFVPRVESQLAFRVSGLIAERLVDLGDVVEAGQPLIRLDEEPLRLAVAELVAEEARALAALEQIERDVRRNRGLVESGAIADADFETLRSLLAQSQAQVRAAHSRLARARNDLTYATLTAPASGTIALVQADVGQVVAAGTPVLRLARGGEHEIEVNVPESRIGQMANGQAAKVRLLSLPERELTARVREIASVADTQTRTYRVRLALLELPAAARLGMTASVRFDTASSNQQLQLPLTALFQQGEQPAVWVLSDAADRLELRPVTLAAMGSDTITLTDGIAPGERVVIAGVHRLDPAMPVQAWDGGLP